MTPADPSVERIQTTCCVVGGGPAGMITGYLLARAGIGVVVLEKHADFLRDFRGDTIHPSTLEIMYELGILDEFLQRPHQEFSQIGGQIEDFKVTIGDFRYLPTHCKFIALMPQWDFLNFIAEKAKLYPRFHLRMQSEVTGLLEEPVDPAGAPESHKRHASNRVTGAIAQTPQGRLEVRAALTVGADGRHSTVREISRREQAGLEVIDLGAPIDVLWMRLQRHPGDPNETLGRFRAGKMLVTLNRGDYWQCAYVIPKGEFANIQQRGLPAFREDLATVAPFLRQTPQGSVSSESRLTELESWDQVKLLSVAVDRLSQWSRPGLLCIGDSAHAMSPIGGVGINLAIQDAVAAANILAEPLLQMGLEHGMPGKAIDQHLWKVQARRQFPTRITQAAQVFAHKRFLAPTLGNPTPLRRMPLPLWLLQKFPVLRRIPARLIGVGVRPEHVRTRDTKVAPAL